MELRLFRAFAGLICSVVFAVPQAIAAQPAPQCPSLGDKAVSFQKVTEGGFLTDDGVEVRLSGVISSDASRETLAAALRQGALTMSAEAQPDRYGRIVANVFADGAWVQGVLLRQGAVRAAPSLASPSCTAALLKAEEEGRKARAGHWGDGVFRVFAPEDVRSRAGTFQVVEGKVTSATVYRGRAYINFGPDYRTDFTVTVSPADMRVFRRAKFDVAGLSGKRVRVRGWMESYNGPEIEVASPAAIEVLEK